MQTQSSSSHQQKPRHWTRWLLIALPVGAAIIALTALASLAPSRARRATSSRDAGITFSSPHSYSKAVADTKTVALNQPVPDFTYNDVDGTLHHISELRGQMPLLFFADMICPCVQAYDNRMKALQQKFAAQGLRVIYVFPLPGEKPAQIKKFAQTRGYNWPLVRDGEQKLINLFNAQCTTEAFLIDREGKLRYHGRVDDSIYDTTQIQSTDLENAIVALLSNQAVPRPETKAYACTITRLVPEKAAAKAPVKAAKQSA